MGQERAIAMFEKFFAMTGDKVRAGILFVCSDMWQPYLRVIREQCLNALNILDKFHIVAEMVHPRAQGQPGYSP